jgi:hypothetical protein
VRAEGAGAGMLGPVVVKATRDKVAAIAAAQRAGTVDGRFPEATLLEFIQTLSRTGLPPGRPQSKRAIAAHRAAIKAAVAALVAPAPE